MKFYIICLLFALLVIYANAQWVADEVIAEEGVAPIRAKRQWGMGGWGYGRPYGYGYGRPWGRPWGGGMWGGGWGYPGGMWG
ncbi:hypothetical protein ANCCEY_07626 [Ancylostoma ceylanicum]|uniref:Uncharacterized protein n=2 Tax=Ancylostoma ceylanicum TaxID=53326 RepID=A0A0D6LTC4_9BILA|nr:hypothetical protein ANCCEY_07626 [Ancylostoma ceylanicum]EYB91245.1 hypothetical protein Y032_0208g2070 [Ancylostoma ceylanicum]